MNPDMQSRFDPQREKPRRAQANRPDSQPAAATDLALVVVIAACFVPVGLLGIAASGGGLPAVAIAFIAEAVITAVLTRLIVRATNDARADSP